MLLKEKKKMLFWDQEGATNLNISKVNVNQTIFQNRPLINSQLYAKQK